MKKHLPHGFVALWSAFVPLSAFAATDFSSLTQTFASLLTQLVPIFISVAVIFFFYGMLKFILKAGTPEGRKEGIATMIVGIVVLFVMVSFWGIVAILQNTFDIGDEGAQVPGVEYFMNIE